MKNGLHAVYMLMILGEFAIYGILGLIVGYSVYDLINKFLL